MQKRTKSILMAAACAATVLTFQEASAASTLTVSLGDAASFGVLAGAGVTIAGPENSSSITGDIGSFETPSITGLENLILDGVNHAGDGVTQSAKTSLMLAYIDAASRPADTTYASGYNLTGTLLTGVYMSGGSLSLTGSVTLDAQGDPDAVWIFQMASSFDVASGAQVFLANGAQASNVFWQVGSSAVIGTGATVEGSILASISITLNTGSVLNGRALASTGAVTLGSATVTVPEPSGYLLAAIGLGVFGIKRRR